ncbi:MAG: LuxR C-terminal-related transcriptional regulator [Mycobacteriales bacterium]
MSHSALRQSEPPDSVLVCAPRPASDEPVVVLAGSSYETDSERVFLDGADGREVVRVPLSAAISVRPVRRFPDIPPGPETDVPTGELALLRAIAHARSGLRQEDTATPAGTLLAQTFTSALRAGDAAASTHLAALLATRRGVAGVYQAISECLAELGDAWAQDRSPVLAERVATHAAMSVCDRLRANVAPPTASGTVVLATPPGERHTLALSAVAHLLQDTGRPVLVVDDLPLDELAELAAEPGTAAVVLSAHVRLSVAAARRLVTALRSSAPDALIAGGGPGFPRTASVGADVVTDDVKVLLRALDERSSALTVREREVLLAVADGLTNPEIAARLHVSASTVKTHLDHVLAKTGAEHRAAAVAQALRKGWIT